MRRIKYIDVAKFIAVFLVLLDHAQYSISVGNTFMVIRVLWISVFLQIFYISSGCVGKFSEIQNTNHLHEFIKKRFKTLIVPYIVWCFMLNYSGDHSIWFFYNILLGTVDSLENVGVNSVLWFLPSIFTANIIAGTIFLFINKNKSRKNIFILAGITILLLLQQILNTLLWKNLVWGLRSAFVGAAFILSGVLLRNILEKIYNDCTWGQKWGIGLGLLVIAVPLAYMNMPVVLENNVFVGYRYAVWMAQGYTGRNIVLFFIVGLLFSLSLFLISMCLEKISILEYLGRRSMLFMTEHIYTHSIVASCIVPNISWMTEGASAFGTLFFVLFSVAIIVLTFPFVDRYMSFLYK